MGCETSKVFMGLIGELEGRSFISGDVCVSSQNMTQVPPLADRMVSDREISLYFLFE